MNKLELILIIMVAFGLLSQAVFAESNLLQIKAANNTLVGTDSQLITITIAKPSSEKLVDAELTLQVITGQAYFSETNGKIVSKKYAIIDKDLTETYHVLLDRGYTGEKSEILVSGTLSYYTQGKKYKWLGSEVRSVNPSSESKQTSFVGVWTDVAPVKTALEMCQANLNDCNKEKGELSNSVKQLTQKISNLEQDKNVLVAENSGLKWYKTYFWPALVLVGILTGIVGWILSKIS